MDNSSNKNTTHTGNQIFSAFYTLVRGAQNFEQAYRTCMLAKDWGTLRASEIRTLTKTTLDAWVDNPGKTHAKVISEGAIATLRVWAEYEGVEP